MKRARPPLPRHALANGASILTTGDAARLLRVHPKHVYRLLQRGLPGHRVGGEWRFHAEEVLRWSGALAARTTARVDANEAESPVAIAAPPSLLAANGDLAVESLLSNFRAPDVPSMGFVQADRGEALALLGRGAVLAAGCHGEEIPRALAGDRLAFIHLVDREIGLALRRGVRVRRLSHLGRRRIASRPASAGVRAHFDRELHREGIDPEVVHGNATLLCSHREVVCAVARGDVDVGLASVAWARHVGLASVPLCTEPYGLLVRASLLGDPRVVRLCEVAQSAAFRRELAAIPGYDARLAGVISYHPIGARPRQSQATPEDAA